MRLIVELIDSTESNCQHLEELLAEQLSRTLRPIHFQVKRLQIVDGLDAPSASVAAEAGVRKDPALPEAAS